MADLIVMLLAAFGIGAIISRVRFRTAQLPPFRATSDLGIWGVLLTGLRWLALMVAVFAVLGLLAYGFAGRKWRESFWAASEIGARYGRSRRFGVAFGFVRRPGS